MTCIFLLFTVSSDQTIGTFDTLCFISIRLSKKKKNFQRPCSRNSATNSVSTIITSEFAILPCQWPREARDEAAMRTFSRFN